MKSIWPFSDRHTVQAATKLYETVVHQSRQPAFYTFCGVPDTVDGRFDMITLHIFLILHRLKNSAERSKEPRTRELAQAVFDTMFTDMDQNLREMGVGDLGVSRRIKDMVSAFYGRVTAYDKALASQDNGFTAVAAAIGRNIFPESPEEVENPARIAAYLRRETDRLAALPLEALAAGEVAFGPPPGIDVGEKTDQGPDLGSGATLKNEGAS